MGRKKMLKGVLYNKPDGATHYAELQEMYYALEDGVWNKCVNGDWWLCKAPMCDLTTLDEINLK